MFIHFIGIFFWLVFFICHFTFFLSSSFSFFYTSLSFSIHMHYIYKEFMCAAFYFFLIGVQLLYNVVLVFVVQQSESAMCIHISPPS